MCLLSISTGKFLLVAFAALCIYELGVFLYFRLVKGKDSNVSKNESRKRRERVQDSPKHKPEPRAITSKRGKESQRKGDVPDWEDLIDYRKTNQVASRENVSRETVRKPSVIDVFSPADTHVDFSRMDELSRQSVDDLLGDAPSPASDVTSPSREAKERTVLPEKDIHVKSEVKADEPSAQTSSASEPKQPAFDVNSVFVDCDFSNMEG